MPGVALVVDTGYQDHSENGDVVHRDQKDEGRAHTPHNHRGNQVHWPGLMSRYDPGAFLSGAALLPLSSAI